MAINRPFYVLIALSFFIFFSSYALAMEMLGRSRIAEGEPAPLFTLFDLDGQEINLSDYRGADVILFFWATSCPYCLKDILELEKRYPKLKANNIEVLAIDIGETKRVVERSLRKYSISFPIVLDFHTFVARDFGIIGIPTYIVIDKKGRVKSYGHSFPEEGIEQCL